VDTSLSDLILQPRAPLGALAFLAAAALGLVALAIRRRSPGQICRALALAVMIVALLDPRLLVERWESLTDAVLLVVDRSRSQTLADRDARTEQAAAKLDETIRNAGAESIRVDAGGARNSRLLQALQEAAGGVAASRIAGAVVITDGLVDDPERLDAFPGPVHALLTGAENEFDRSIRILRTPAFGVVGDEIDVELLAEEAPMSSESPLEILARVDGRPLPPIRALPGEPHTVKVPVDRTGTLTFEARVESAANELAAVNNVAAFTFEGVRDRLQVLLVSGSPHPALRVWRGLLRADPAVDLIHLSILRLPDSFSPAPAEEMSLIEFPHKRVFEEELDRFDLLVFDRFGGQWQLAERYLGNIARYVEEGGALLVAGRGQFTEAGNLVGGGLDGILPLQPAGAERTGSYRARITEAGARHPVTADIADALSEAGKWRRLLETTRRSGDILLTGSGGLPLLALSRAGAGRVAVLASEQAWLWARGHEGGGPHQELLRRLAHWLMGEPDLEEEALHARQEGSRLVATRQTMAETPADVWMEGPNGDRETLQLSLVAPGRWEAHLENADEGLYRFGSGSLQAVAVIGDPGGGESRDLVAAADRIEPAVEILGGSVRQLREGVPEIRFAKSELSGTDDRLAFRKRNARRQVGSDLITPWPPWLALALALAALTAAWAWESGLPRRRREPSARTRPHGKP